jgi:hypothetical protein
VTFLSQHECSFWLVKTLIDNLIIIYQFSGLVTLKPAALMNSAPTTMTGFTSAPPQLPTSSTLEVRSVSRPSASTTVASSVMVPTANTVVSPLVKTSATALSNSRLLVSSVPPSTSLTKASRSSLASPWPRRELPTWTESPPTSSRRPSSEKPPAI